MAGIQGFQRDGDRDEYTSYFKCSLPTPHDDPLSVITVDTLSYVMTTENRAFIERTSAYDQDKTFSINWIAYTLQLMLGAEHYGMQVGEIFHGGRRATDDGIHTQSEKTNWWCYNLPPPARKSGMVAMKTCFPPLLLFLMFRHLERLQAFNRGGMDWTKMKESKAEYSEVGIAVAADGTMFAIYCLKNSRQVDLQIRMAVDPSVQFFGACNFPLARICPTPTLRVRKATQALRR